MLREEATCPFGLLVAVPLVLPVVRLQSAHTLGVGDALLVGSLAPPALEAGLDAGRVVGVEAPGPQDSAHVLAVLGISPLATSGGARLRELPRAVVGVLPQLAQPVAGQGGVEHPVV